MNQQNSPDIESWLKLIRADGVGPTTFAKLLKLFRSIDRALGEKPTELEPAVDKWIAGFAMVRDSFKKMLENFNVKEMDTYQIFDPEYHEALVQVESDKH